METDLSILVDTALIFAIVCVLIRVCYKEAKKHNWKVVEKWDGLHHREGEE